MVQHVPCLNNKEVAFLKHGWNFSRTVSRETDFCALCVHFPSESRQGPIVILRWDSISSACNRRQSHSHLKGVHMIIYQAFQPPCPLLYKEPSSQNCFQIWMKPEWSPTQNQAFSLTIEQSMLHIYLLINSSKYNGSKELFFVGILISESSFDIQYYSVM